MKLKKIYFSLKYGDYKDLINQAFIIASNIFNRIDIKKDTRDFLTIYNHTLFGFLGEYLLSGGDISSINKNMYFDLILNNYKCEIKTLNPKDVFNKNKNWIKIAKNNYQQKNIKFDYIVLITYDIPYYKIMQSIYNKETLNLNLIILNILDKSEYIKKRILSKYYPWYILHKRNLFKNENEINEILHKISGGKTK